MTNLNVGFVYLYSLFVQLLNKCLYLHLSFYRLNLIDCRTFSPPPLNAEISRIAAQLFHLNLI